MSQFLYGFNTDCILFMHIYILTRGGTTFTHLLIHVVNLCPLVRKSYYYIIVWTGLNVLFSQMLLTPDFIQPFDLES